MRKLFASLCLLSLGACNKAPKNEVWIYTSTYKEVLALYEKDLNKEFPDIKIKWFQQGSENVAAKILAEQSGGETKADIMMTSDLFFYQEQKHMGKLEALPEAITQAIPPNLVDPDRAFVVTRFPVMVLAVNKNKISDADRPTSFKDLTLPRFKNKVTMPSPLDSGTALASVLYLNKMFGAPYFEALRKNEILAAGGNGAVFSRLQSGEKPVGVILMENVLQAREKGNNFVDFIVPSEGALAIPSPIAVFKSSKNKEAALKVTQWFLSPAGQAVLSKGWIYSAFANEIPPAGGPRWADLKLQPWDLKTFEAWGAEKQKTKEVFQNTVLK